MRREDTSYLKKAYLLDEIQAGLIYDTWELQDEKSLDEIAQEILSDNHLDLGICL